MVDRLFGGVARRLSRHGAECVVQPGDAPTASEPDGHHPHTITQPVSVSVALALGITLGEPNPVAIPVVEPDHLAFAEPGPIPEPGSVTEPDTVTQPDAVSQPGGWHRDELAERGRAWPDDHGGELGWRRVGAVRHRRRGRRRVAHL